MTNQGENKNKNHINTGVSFEFIQHIAGLLGWGGADFWNNTAWKRMSNFYLPVQKIDWEGQVKTLRVKFITGKCISQQFEQHKFEKHFPSHEGVTDLRDLTEIHEICRWDKA